MFFLPLISINSNSCNKNKSRSFSSPCKCFSRRGKVWLQILYGQEHLLWILQKAMNSITDVWWTPGFITPRSRKLWLNSHFLRSAVLKLLCPENYSFTFTCFILIYPVQNRVTLLINGLWFDYRQSILSENYAENWNNHSFLPSSDRTGTQIL